LYRKTGAKMTTNLFISFKDHFKGSDIITINEIRNFLGTLEVALSDVNVRKKIYLLKNEGIIIQVKRGFYKIPEKIVFTPQVDNIMLKAVDLHRKTFREINYCTWSSAWYSDYMIHQPFSSFYIFETEKDTMESLFNIFKENKLNPYLKPDRSILENYAYRSKYPIVIKQFHNRSPLILIDNIVLPRIEKLLVDLFCDKDYFYIYQGQEMKNIFRNIFKTYDIDYSKLLNYADRRENKDKLKKFLWDNITGINKELLK
jgi:hypothetical protein